MGEQKDQLQGESENEWQDLRFGKTLATILQ